MNTLDPFSIPITGVELVDASAGTGKTHTIATLFLRLILERSLTVDRILVVTFTKAATAELRERIRKRLAEALATFETGPGPDQTLARLYERTRDRARARDKLAAAVASADQAAVLTIHGFCQRILDEHAFESGARFDLSLLPDISPLVIEIVQDFWNRKLPSARPEVVEFVRRRRKFSELVRLALLAARNPDVPVVAGSYPEELDLTFDAFSVARRALIAEWRTGEHAAAALLHGSPWLMRNQYSTKTCARVVDEMNAFAKAPNSEQVSDLLYKLSARQIASSLKRGGIAPRHAVFDRAEAMIDAWESSKAKLEAWAQAFEAELAAFVKEELPVRARARGILSFDDLLHDMQRALAGSSGATLAATVRRRFPAAIIDEFHDTDPVQYDIFRRLYRGQRASLFLIGDPKQAIYAFRGADVYAYLAATHDADHRFTLTTNHRSDPSLIRAVNGVFGRTEAPFILDEIRFEPVAARPSAADELSFEGTPASGIEFVFVPRTDTERGKSRPSPEIVPGLVAHEIAALLASGATICGRPLRAGDIAVLTRTNAEARDVQSELRELGVTGVLHGDSSVLDTDEAVEMAIVLRALADPGNPTAVRSALATSLLGQSAAELFELGEDEGAWERRAESFRRWHDVWKTHGILSAARRMLSDEGAAARLLGVPGGERSLTNFVHLIELLHKHAVEQHAGMAGLIAWFDDVRHKEDARGGVAPEAQQVRLESDEYAVQLTTMHRSKGLEYPVVYLPHLWKGAGLFGNDKKNLLYHDRHAGNRKVLDLRSEQQKQAELLEAERESLAEAQRLTYVALTRAKHRAIVVWGAFRNVEKSALARLLHPTVAESADRVSDAELLADLEALARGSEGSVVVRPHVTSLTSLPAAPPSGPPLRARSLPVRRLSMRRTSSFTGLSSGADAPDSPIDEARDIDATETGSDAPELGGGESRGHGKERIQLDDFPRGPRAGDALHGILERIDFERSDESELPRVVTEQLALHGIDGNAWSVPLVTALDDVLRTPLDGVSSPLSLSRIAPSHKCAEMEFTFPVSTGPGGRAALSANALAGALRKRDGLPRGYADRVAALDFAPLTGFLRGFIDLVFEHDGRFYVVDYKSNHLGPSADDYTRDALETVMSAHHYFLQYHLYAVALDRFLRARLKDYDRSRHFGGVYYLFVRGMSRERGPRTGVFFDRPDEECLAALSTTLEGARGRTKT